MTDEPYNPLAKANLAKSIEIELLSRSTTPLDEIGAITGAGVYIIYYRGKFGPYAQISVANAQAWTTPIYVGKAIPRGGRKGAGFGSPSGSAVLAARLRKHADSIRATENLRIEDFAFRHIILDEIWIPLGENILIESYRPLWNVAIEGFGINDPGAGRLQQKRSSWDVLHPGRDYAARLTGGGPELSAILARVEGFFSGITLRPMPDELSAFSTTAAAEEEGEEGE